MDTVKTLLARLNFPHDQGSLDASVRKALLELEVLRATTTVRAWLTGGGAAQPHVGPPK